MINPDLYFGRLGNRLFQLAYIYGQMRKGRIPDIYVQNPIYFEEYRNELKAIFNHNNKPIDKVAIHVRRGDYVKNDFYVDLMSTDYYQRAMQEFQGEQFIVFSDDLNYCREQAVFKDCFFYPGLSEIEDLTMISSCKGVIIANSSFSWWGAFLSDAKKVVAPKAWYSDGRERTKLLKDWIRI